MKRILLIFIIVFIPSLLLAQSHAKPERHYQNIWCQENDGKQEYRLDDATRVDCLTASHAVEFDFEHKWAEAIGQALYYSAKTGKRAGIVLIQKEDKKSLYLIRLKTTIKSFWLPIDVWVMPEVTE